MSRNTRLYSQRDQDTDNGEDHCGLERHIITHHHRLQIPNDLSMIYRSQERDNETRAGDLYQEIIEGASGHLRLSDMERQTKEDFPQ